MVKLKFKFSLRSIIKNYQKKVLTFFKISSILFNSKKIDYPSSNQKQNYWKKLIKIKKRKEKQLNYLFNHQQKSFIPAHLISI